MILREQQVQILEDELHHRISQESKDIQISFKAAWNDGLIAFKVLNWHTVHLELNQKLEVEFFLRLLKARVFEGQKIFLKGFDLKNCDLSDIGLRDCFIENCKIIDCNLNNANFEGATITNTEIMSPSLHQAKFLYCMMERVTISKGDISTQKHLGSKYISKPEDLLRFY